jgi:2'-5' RNA ligase
LTDRDPAVSEPAKIPSLRLFIAVELPPPALSWCQQALDRARQALGPEETVVRWVRPEGIHVTLKFLGSVAMTKIPDLVARLNDTMADQPVFELAVGRLGVFPGARAPRVTWLGLLGDLANLRAAQERVEIATVPLGFPREARPFQPHLTLGRVRETASPEQRAAIGRLPGGWPDGASRSFQVEHISLMRSELGPGGARYSRVAEVRLAVT